MGIHKNNHTQNTRRIYMRMVASHMPVHIHSYSRLCQSHISVYKQSYLIHVGYIYCIGSFTNACLWTHHLNTHVSFNDEYNIIIWCFYEQSFVKTCTKLSCIVVYIQTNIRKTSLSNLRTFVHKSSTRDKFMCTYKRPFVNTYTQLSCAIILKQAFV